MIKRPKTIQTLTGVTIYILSLLPAAAFAAALGAGKLTENVDPSTKAFLQRIQSWLLGLVSGLAVLFLIYGGLLYITSGGNKERIETAKKTITYAVWGLILIVMAGVIFEVITGDFMTSIFGNNNL